MSMFTNKIVLFSLGAAVVIAGITLHAMNAPTAKFGLAKSHRSPECEDMSANMLGRCTGQAKNVMKPHCVRMREDYAKLCR